MADSQDLLTAAAALLVLALGLHIPALTQRIPRSAWTLVAAGAVLPLLDPVIANLSADDQIGALTRAPLFAGPLVGLGTILIAALAVAIWSGVGAARFTLTALAGGYALHLVLAATTAPGVPWLGPLNTVPQGWSLFPQGHPVLILLLPVSLATLEALRGRIPWLPWATVGIVTLYGVFAAGGYLLAASTVPPVSGDATRRIVEPDGWLPNQWRVIDETPREYRITLLSLGADAPAQPKPVARWNDEALLLQALDDPVVFRLYRRAFLHPVAELAVSSSQTILTVQELTQRLTGSEGPTFVLKTDSDGRNRLYRLERFD